MSASQFRDICPGVYKNVLETAYSRLFGRWVKLDQELWDPLRGLSDSFLDNASSRYHVSLNVQLEDPLEDVR